MSPFEKFKTFFASPEKFSQIELRYHSCKLSRRYRLRELCWKLKMVIN